jgi:translation initiation factor IF-2
MGKVRIYDLAKELKLESKKVLEDARRMGVDVSVPSNTLDDNIAAKIRETYYPKKEQTPAPRTARLIKHHPAAAPAAETPIPAETVPTTAQAEPAQPLSSTSGPSGLSAPTAQPNTNQAAVLGTPKMAPPPAARTIIPPGETKPQTTVGEGSKAKIVKLQPVPMPAARVETPPVEETVPAKIGVGPATSVNDLAGLSGQNAVPQVQREEEVKPEVLEKPAEERAQVIPPETARPPQQPGIRVAPSKATGTAGGAHEGRLSGTKVIKLTPPPKPLPKPAPLPPPRTPEKRDATARLKPQIKPPVKPQLKEDQRVREGQREGREKGVHILPSGAQQRTVYIPPKDQRPKGRHQQRKEKEKEKEGQQKVMPRRQMAAVTVPRTVVAELKSARLVEGSSVREFAEKIDAKPRDIVTMLMQRGVMATINQTINPDVAREIGKDYGFDISFGDFEDMIVESEFEITPEAMEDTDPRAPVVTVMGHVDHGKTSLLDAIRQSRVAEGEAGGITQHIGAYSVEVPDPDNRSKMRRVVFLDTPGHEAFTMMRARGAKVTNIVVLVVAADDGVMPQTVEAIEHARAAGVPIVVAINKIDKADANIERVKKELADRGLLWDGWGGQTTIVEVSAKKKQNIEGLLEMILLTADLLELKSNPKRMATGTVLEAKLDRGRGAVATVLIQNGTLHVGEPLIVGNFFGKVRALMNDRGERVQEAGPATPVEVLGLEGVPAAGDQFQVVDDVAKAQQISQFRQTQARVTALARTAARGLDQLAAQMASGEVKELLVILKADVQGSAEVLKDRLVKLSTEKVKVRIIRSGVGAITEDDVLRASASNATETGAATVIIGFNVRPEARADEVARQEDVDIRLHSIIYKVEEEIRNAMLGLLDATIKEVVIGEAEVRDVIRVPKVGSVAGCMIISGSIKRTAHARLIRDNVVIFESQIGSLRRFKEDVSEVQQGFECGITLERFTDYKIGDVIEAFVTEKVAPTKL